MGFPEQYFLEVRPPKDPWDTFVRPSEWKDDILRILQTIAATNTGMVLLRTLQSTAKWISVEPTNFGECNAHGSVMAPTVLDGRTFLGIVKFDPQSYMQGSFCYRSKKRDDTANNRGFLPEEVMFHETIHAHRGTLRLTLNPEDAAKLGGGLVRYQHEEEFVAVVITNIYASDPTNRHSSGLRADHSGGRPLEPGLDTSLEFFQSSPQVLPLLKRFASQEKSFFEGLAAVKASFNPFAAMVDHPREIEKLSQSKLALDREKNLRAVRPPAGLSPEQKAKQLMGGLSGLGKEALRALGSL